MRTRKEILDYLEKHTFGSAEDISPLLSQTRANIQYHLKQLEKIGTIFVVTPKRGAIYRGRPRRYYSLTAAERPSNMLQLAHAVLSTHQAENLPQTEFYKAIANRLLHLPGTRSSGTTRINRLVKELTSRGYQARWEAHSSGPALLFHNCPYAELISEHPELCQIDRLILEENLGIRFFQQFQIDLPRIPACIFLKRL